jgi:hypothetical protein
MDPVTNEPLAALSFLLPGFVTAWVFFGLVPFPKPSQFERVVQALIYTMLVQAVVFLIRTVALALGAIASVGDWSSGTALFWSVVVALSFGLVFSRWATHDTVLSLLRARGFTSVTSYPSQWFFEFSRNRFYVVLHLDGNRRLYGWPEQWPSDPGRGQFSIAEAEWLTDNGRIPASGVRNVLVPAGQVQLVEFMHPIKSE